MLENLEKMTSSYRFESFDFFLFAFQQFKAVFKERHKGSISSGFGFFSNFQLFC